MLWSKAQRESKGGREAALDMGREMQRGGGWGLEREWTPALQTASHSFFGRRLPCVHEGGVCGGVQHLQRMANGVLRKQNQPCC